MVASCNDEQQKERERGKFLSNKIKDLKDRIALGKNTIRRYQDQYESMRKPQKDTINRLMKGRAWIGCSTTAVDIHELGGTEHPSPVKKRFMQV